MRIPKNARMDVAPVIEQEDTDEDDMESVEENNIEQQVNIQALNEEERHHLDPIFNEFDGPNIDLDPFAELIGKKLK